MILFQFSRFARPSCPVSIRRATAWAHHIAQQGGDAFLKRGQFDAAERAHPPGKLRVLKMVHYLVDEPIRSPPEGFCVIAFFAEERQQDMVTVRIMPAYPAALDFIDAPDDLRVT